MPGTQIFWGSSNCFSDNKQTWIMWRRGDQVWDKNIWRVKSDFQRWENFDHMVMQWAASSREWVHRSVADTCGDGLCDWSTSKTVWKWWWCGGEEITVIMLILYLIIVIQGKIFLSIIFICLCLRRKDWFWREKKWRRGRLKKWPLLLRQGNTSRKGSLVSSSHKLSLLWKCAQCNCEIWALLCEVGLGRAGFCFPRENPRKENNI